MAINFEEKQSTATNVQRGNGSRYEVKEVVAKRRSRDSGVILELEDVREVEEVKEVVVKILI
jgi:hypothetical protein